MNVSSNDSVLASELLPPRTTRTGGLRPLGLAVLALMVCSCGFADLRSARILERGVDLDDQIRGREILTQVARLGGIDRWNQYERLSVVATDSWDKSWLAARFNWWTEASQRLQHDTLLGTFTSRVKLLDGSESGLTLGIQAWHAYKQSPPVFEPDDRTSFYLPTLQYFSELPFRLLNAEVVQYAGTGTFAGKQYQRVFVTWGNYAPHSGVDHFDVWVDPDTSRIFACHYTVREAFDWAEGTVFYSDYRQVQGVWLPFVHTVTLKSPQELAATPQKVVTEYFHQLRIDSAVFDSAASEGLIVSTLWQPGDRKPQL